MIRNLVSNYRMREDDGHSIQDCNREAVISFQIHGKQQTQIFRILEETGDDLIVLGIPWLRSTNPPIDGRKKTMVVGKVSARKASTDREDDKEPSVPRPDRPETVN
jgi:hypothetical protein